MRRLAIFFEVGKGTLDESISDSLSRECLLTNAGNHLRDIDSGAFRTTCRHNERAASSIPERSGIGKESERCGIKVRIVFG